MKVKLSVCQHFIVDAKRVCKRCGVKVKLLNLKEEMADLRHKHRNLRNYL